MGTSILFKNKNGEYFEYDIVSDQFTLVDSSSINDHSFYPQNSYHTFYKIQQFNQTLGYFLIFENDREVDGSGSNRWNEDGSSNISHNNLQTTPADVLGLIKSTTYTQDVLIWRGITHPMKRVQITDTMDSSKTYDMIDMHPKPDYDQISFAYVIEDQKMKALCFHNNELIEFVAESIKPSNSSPPKPLEKKKLSFSQELKKKLDEILNKKKDNKSNYNMSKTHMAMLVGVGGLLVLGGIILKRIPIK